MRIKPIALLLFLLACDHSESRRDVAPATVRAADASAPAVVSWHGNLKSIFGGDWSAAVMVRDVVSTSDVYALGALSDLRGELLVIGGKVMLVYPTETAFPRVTVESGTSNEAATLLVAASVHRWRELTFDGAVSGEELEAAILARAEANGVDVSRPFPFLLRGQFRDLAWHVADGTRVEPGMRPDSNAQHGTLAEGAGTVLGFYSSQHQGVFTMMGQNTHMHFVSSDHAVLGHVRTLELGPGCVLSLPADWPALSAAAAGSAR